MGPRALLTPNPPEGCCAGIRILEELNDRLQKCGKCFERWDQESTPFSICPMDRLARFGASAVQELSAEIEQKIAALLKENGFARKPKRRFVRSLGEVDHVVLIARSRFAGVESIDLGLGVKSKFVGAAFWKDISWADDLAMDNVISLNNLVRRYGGAQRDFFDYDVAQRDCAGVIESDFRRDGVRYFDAQRSDSALLDFLLTHAWSGNTAKRAVVAVLLSKIDRTRALAYVEQNNFRTSKNLLEQAAQQLVARHDKGD